MDRLRALPRTARLAVAATALLATAATAGERPAGADQLEVTLTLYGWATSLDGEAAVGGRQAEVDVPFSDILDDLSFAGMGTLVVRKGRLGAYLAPFFARVGSSEDLVRLRNDTTMVGFGGLWRLVDWRPEEGSSAAVRSARLEVLGGGRLVDLRLELDGRRGLPSADTRETWVEPVVGLAGRLELGDRLEAFAEGDLGGFGLGSDLSWQWLAGAGWRLDVMGPATYARAGYRMLGLDYEEGGFEWDVTYKGPFVGLTFRF
jgi:hypothetical protein